MLSAVALLLILGIAFFYGLQGLFSSLLMLICTVACTLLAFNYYEPVAAMLYSTKPAHAESIALITMLVLPLLALRILLDRFLRGNVVPSMWVDRIGGGVLGLLIGLLLIGTLLIALQMAPFERAIFGYDPYDDDLQANSSLILDAPAFTLGLVKTVSDGSFASDESFAAKHDNLIMELWATRNRLPGARTGCQPGAMIVLDLYDVTTATYPGQDKKSFGEMLPAYPTAPADTVGRSQVLLARVTVNEDSRDDKWWLLPGTHFRLATTDGASFYPIGYLVRFGGMHVVTDSVGKLAINRPAIEGREGTGVSGRPIVVDLLYRVPFAEGEEKPRTPRFMAFRRHLAANKSLPEIKVIDPAKLASNVKRLQAKLDAEKDKATRAKLAKAVAEAQTAATPSGQLKPLAVLALQKKRIDGKVKIALSGDDFPFRPERARTGNDLPVQFTVRDKPVEGLPYEVITVKKMNERNRPTHRLRWGWAKGKNKVLTPQKISGRNIRNLWMPSGKIAVFLEALRPEKKTTGLPKTDAEKAAFLRPSIIYETPDGTVHRDPAAGAWVQWSGGGEGSGHILFHSPTGRGITVGDAPATVAPKDPPDLTDITNSYIENMNELIDLGVIFIVPENVTVVGFHLQANGPRIMCKQPLRAKKGKR